MSWYQLLPDHLSVYETWVVRFFVFLGLLNLAPWVIAMIFDILLYIYRVVYHVIPVYGGRARGDDVPSVPTVSSVNSTRRRTISLVGLVSGRNTTEAENGAQTSADVKQRNNTNHDGVNGGEKAPVAD